MAFKVAKSEADEADSMGLERMTTATHTRAEWQEELRRWAKTGKRLRAK